MSKKTVEDAVDNLRQEMRKNHGELDERIENLHKEIAVKHNEVMTKLYSIAGLVEKFDEE